MLDEETLFFHVLRDLADEHEAFAKNYWLYRGWDQGRRTRWIEHIKRQAATVPFAEHLVMEVTRRRLRS